VLGVFDGQRVQAELLAEHLKVAIIRIKQVEPDHRPVVLVQVVTDVCDREAGCDQVA
jgi:hypothetical protein